VTRRANFSSAEPALGRGRGNSSAMASWTVVTRSLALLPGVKDCQNTMATPRDHPARTGGTDMWFALLTGALLARTLPGRRSARSWWGSRRLRGAHPVRTHSGVRAGRVGRDARRRRGGSREGQPRRGGGVAPGLARPWPQAHAPDRFSETHSGHESRMTAMRPPGQAGQTRQETSWGSFRLS